MKATLDGLHGLTNELDLLRHWVALPQVDGRQACQQLSRSLEALREKCSSVKSERPKLDVQQVWAHFAGSRFDLTALNDLQFRALCSSEETALRREFIAALARNPAKLKRSRFLYGIVLAYFTLWGEVPDAASVESLVLAALSDHDRRNPVVRKWLGNPSLFSDKAAGSLAKQICDGLHTVDEVLKYHYISPVSNLGLRVRSDAARLGSGRFRDIEGDFDNENALKYLRWLTEDVLSQLTFPDALTDSVSRMIVSGAARKSESFQRALRSFVQANKRLGDPRLRENAPNWRAMVPEAAQRYLSWLARDNINFFFNTILPNNSENRRRKDFWLRYCNAIKDFQVAVSETDEWTVKANRKAAETIVYSHIAHPTTSAFLMEFEGYGGQRYLIVEFSEKGNAAYIFKLADFKARGRTLRSVRFELKRDLKFDTSQRIFHSGDWEIAAGRRLVVEFGIRP